MNRSSLFFCVLIAVVVFSPLALADSVFGSAGAGWQSWVPADLDRNGTPYWDGVSFDGGNKNIGYCLLGTGTCGMSGAPGYLQYWGLGGGVADSAFYLQSTSPSGSLAALRIEIAGLRDRNIFGWYDTTNQKDYAFHVIFGGPASAPATNVYIPTANYGFWFQGDQGVYFTQSSFNTGGAAGKQMFSIFQQTAGRTYWLGMEDRHQSSDFDYNDMVVKITSVPDGGMTLILLGGALIGLETLRRKLSS